MRDLVECDDAIRFLIALHDAECLIAIMAECKMKGFMQSEMFHLLLMQLSRKNVSVFCDDTVAPQLMRERGVTSPFSYIRIVLWCIDNHQTNSHLEGGDPDGLWTCPT